VAHLASPVSFDFSDPEPVLKSAINGTVRALESAVKEPKIKSFVLMSSITAMLQMNRTGDYTYTEADWNTFAEAAVAEQGKANPGRIIYSASKTAAERALWKFRDEHKPSFTVTAINPWYGFPFTHPLCINTLANSE
jgi:nucleoside-diphosphate-sugar epimerase